MDVIKNYDPGILKNYRDIYMDDKWGRPNSSYSTAISSSFRKIAGKYGMPVRIPQELFSGILDKNDLVTVILEHIDYLLKLRGGSSPYGYAAYSVSRLEQPLSDLKVELRKIQGVGAATEKIVLEILETGSSSYYAKLMREF